MGSLLTLRLVELRIWWRVSTARVMVKSPSKKFSGTCAYPRDILDVSVNDEFRRGWETRGSKNRPTVVKDSGKRGRSCVM